MSIPHTMQASVLVALRTIELEERPVPAPGPGQVLVRITAVGSCGSDTHFYETGAIGDLVVLGPIVLGHETAGQIVAVGEGVDTERIGVRVAVEPQTPCRRCEFCKGGEYNLCPNVRFYGAYPVDGSFVEFALIDDDFAHAVPDSMTDEEAALVEPLSVALHAARRAGISAGSRVLITGAGPIGIVTAAVAKSLGATEVVVSDPIPHRREFILDHGADVTIDPTTDNFAPFTERFDVYIDASGNAGAINASWPTIKRGGIAVLVGMGGDDLTVPIAHLQHREITVTGTYRYANTWPIAIELIRTGAIEVASLVTGRFGLDEVDIALVQAKADPSAIKSMVIPGLGREESL